ncbi:MAG: hypothetical protein EOO65_03530 [Methanosarcinales archaeon]|nr:MAG: hypothetical protein EOO65_03530 [Methanosarcinales archaeon]
MTPLASTSAAPSVAAGSTLVSVVVRIVNVNTPCDVLARDMLFISLMRLSFSVALNVHVNRVHVSVVVNRNCSSTFPLLRRLQSGGSAPVDLDVGIVTSATLTDANVLNATAVEVAIDQTPVTVLLQTLLGSCLHVCLLCHVARTPRHAVRACTALIGTSLPRRDLQTQTSPLSLEFRETACRSSVKLRSARRHFLPEVVG